jgi:hypothetical protein
MSPWYPLGGRLGGPLNRSGRSGEEKNSLSLPGVLPPDHPARSPALYHWNIPCNKHKYCNKGHNVLDAGKEIGLGINTEKPKHVPTSRQQNAERNLNMKITNTSFKTVAQLKCSASTTTHQNYAHGEIKSRLYVGNACCKQSNNGVCLLPWHEIRGNISVVEVAVQWPYEACIVLKFAFGHQHLTKLCIFKSQRLWLQD